jgi:hypothetical protein
MLLHSFGDSLPTFRAEFLGLRLDLPTLLALWSAKPALQVEADDELLRRCVDVIVETWLGSKQSTNRSKNRQLSGHRNRTQFQVSRRDESRRIQRLRMSCRPNHHRRNHPLENRRPKRGLTVV